MVVQNKNMAETTKPPAPKKPSWIFSKGLLGDSKWRIPLIIIFIVLGLYLVHAITPLNLFYFKNLNAPSFTPEPIGVPITYNLAPGLIKLLNPGDTTSPATNYSFYLGTEAGSPPTGLELGVNGELKGTPTVPGDSSFQVCIKDMEGRSTCGMYYMIITPEPAIIFSPPEFLEATELTAYSYSFCKPDSARSDETCGGLAEETTDPTGGKAPYSFSVQFEGLLPPGLALKPNGLLEGKPLLTGKYTFGVCVSDSQDKTCKNVTLTVVPKSASKTKPTPTPTSKTSCPENSHKNPADSSKCLCDTGYQTNSAGNGCVVMSVSLPPSSSCPANSHQNPADSTRCLCDSGYQTNSAGNGCVVASAPPPPPLSSCPANAHQNPSDSSKCLCDTGYQTNSAGDGCAPSDSTKVVCKAGYEECGDSCMTAGRTCCPGTSLSCPGGNTCAPDNKCLPPENNVYGEPCAGGLYGTNGQCIICSSGNAHSTAINSSCSPAMDGIYCCDIIGGCLQDFATMDKSNMTSEQLREGASCGFDF